MAGTRFSAKQERCIKKVKAMGRSKVSAIKICQTTVKKKDVMARKNKQKKRRQKRKAQLKALAKDILNEEALDADEEDQDEELIEEIAEELAEGLAEDIAETETLADIIDELSDDEFEDAIEDAAEVLEAELAEEETEVVEEKKPAPEPVQEVVQKPVQEEDEVEDVEKSLDISPSEALSILFKSVIAKIKKPPEKYASSFVITKDKSGDDRWIGKVTNRWFDREGDILTNASHKRFIKYLDENPDMAPIFLPWHNVKAAFTHPVDSWMYKNGFMVYSGKLTSAEAKSLRKASETTRLGMSHGFFALERELINKKNITKYHTFEVSVLPMNNAANPFTDLEVIAKEINMERKEFLQELLGEEKYKKLLQDTEVAEKLLDDAGVKTKDVEEASQDEVIEKIGEALGLPELSDTFTGMVKELKDGREERKTMASLITVLAEKLDVSQEAQEEQLAKMIEPKAARYAWLERPSQSKDTIVDDEEDEELLKGVPTDEHWLSKSTHTQGLDASKEELAKIAA